MAERENNIKESLVMKNYGILCKQKYKKET